MERKKLRYEYLLERYFTNFHRILLTNLIFAVPSAVFFVPFYLLFFVLGWSLPVAILTLIPLYPFYAGVVLVCRNIARGDSDVPVCKTFFKAVKENFLPFLLHGAVVYAVSMLCYVSISLYVNLLSLGWFFYIPLFFSILIALFLLYAIFYIPLMNVTYELPLKYVYKNSFLMAFFELKNNFFATFALAIILGICLTMTAFSSSAAVLLIILALLWTLLFPATATFMYVFFIYDGMTEIMKSKDEHNKEAAEKDQGKKPQRLSAPVTEEDLSSIDISTLKDTDDYIFHNGRMVKQSTLLRMAKEQQEKSE